MTKFAYAMDELHNGMPVATYIMILNGNHIGKIEFALKRLRIMEQTPSRVGLNLMPHFIVNHGTVLFLQDGWQL